MFMESSVRGCQSGCVRCLSCCQARGLSLLIAPSLVQCLASANLKRGILKDVTTTTLDYVSEDQSGSKMKTKRVLLLKPRGFGAGVVRAIAIVQIALDTFG